MDDTKRLGGGSLVAGGVARDSGNAFEFTLSETELVLQSAFDLTASAGNRAGVNRDGSAAHSNACACARLHPARRSTHHRHKTWR